jgi:geranylgeranyl diphosphate synthase type II
MRVCEGQAEDMEFEERREVTLDEYLDMVTKKTACLLAVSGRLGAVLGGAEAGEEELTEKVLLELGIVFQIQDDLLELTSDAEKMGKTLGSDLVNKKKTFPYLFAKKELPPEEWEDFLAAAAPENIAGQGTGPARRVLERNFIFDKINDIITLRHASIQEMIRKLPPRTQEMFRSMVTFVMHREH